MFTSSVSGDTSKASSVSQLHVKLSSHSIGSYSRSASLIKRKMNAYKPTQTIVENARQVQMQNSRLISARQSAIDVAQMQSAAYIIKIALVRVISLSHRTLRTWKNRSIRTMSDL